VCATSAFGRQAQSPSVVTKADALDVGISESFVVTPPGGARPKPLKGGRRSGKSRHLTKS